MVDTRDLPQYPTPIIHFQFCGPGTHLEKRLARGDKGINALDSACKVHDTSYSTTTDLKERHKADKILASEAWKRVKSSDASIKERLAALAVTSAMKAKVKLGMGTRSMRRLKRKKPLHTFPKFIRQIGNAVKRQAPRTVGAAIHHAVSRAKAIKHNTIRIPKVVSLPKKGGFLPFLIPLFAGLSALGALGGAASSIASTVNKAREGQQALEEAKRHNRSMEAVALGRGMVLAPYKSGCGLYLNSYKPGCGMRRKCVSSRKN